MSQTLAARRIVRCPLCYDGSSPQHIRHGVMLCEACGSTFRVVAATLGKTGARLGRAIDELVTWGPQKR